MSSAKARSRLGSLTIRTRLTLWSAGMIAAVYVVLAAIVFLGLTWLVQAEVDGLLHGQLQELVAHAHEHHNNLDEAARGIRHELGHRHQQDYRFRLVNGDNNELLTSDPEQRFPPVPKSFKLESGGFATLAGSGDYPSVRLHRQWISVGQRELWAEASYSLDRMNANLWRYAALWFATLPLVVVFAGAGGWLIARRSLRPVAEIIAAATQIEGDPSGKRIEVRATGDELDQLAETLNRMLERIERHVGQITQFTADASHELRSSLAALRGAAEVALMRRSSPDELRTVLVNAIEHYDRLTRIAEDLLLLARIDARQNVLNLGPVKIDDLLPRAIELYAAVAESRRVDLVCSSARGLTAQGDAGRLLQLIGNLIDNALNHTPAGGKVELRAEGNVEKVVVTVTDTGKGISAQHLPHVFDRFYRADDSRDRSANPGAGLGLSICKAIAELHGGEISLASQEGQGTQVTFRLPAAAKMNNLSSCC
jgi:heavy metal sensor kinase